MFYPGDVVGDRYRLRSCIARGGMGEIWDAVHIELESPVALKFMAPALVASPIQRDRFSREARATAQIQSPYVVRMSDFGVEGDTPYIVMERLHGEDLATRLSRLGVMAPHEVASLVTQAAKGLALAHEAGIIHRDLKPSNIFLVPEEDGFLVKLVDFGVAKTAPQSRAPHEEVTHTGMVLGSPQYMSPEQALGSRDVDQRADLWALASISLRALTGKRLFKESSSMEALAELCRGRIPPVRQVAPELPEPLIDFFEKALARDIDARFRSARRMSSAFREAVTATRVQGADASSITGASIPAQRTHASLSGASGAAASMPDRGRAVPVAIAMAITGLAVMGVGAAAGLASEEAVLTARGKLVRGVQQRIEPALFDAFKLSIDQEARRDAEAAHRAKAERKVAASARAPSSSEVATEAASATARPAPAQGRPERWGF